MRVVLTQKMVVGHVMRYPGEVVEMADEAEAKVEAEASAQDDSQPETLTPEPVTKRRGRKQP